MNPFKIILRFTVNKQKLYRFCNGRVHIVRDAWGREAPEGPCTCQEKVK